jgi:signal peptidase II
LLPPADDPAPVAPTALPVEVHETAAAAHRSRWRLYWWVSLGIIVVDQITKAMVRSTLGLFENKPIIPGFLDLVHVRNEGVAFGLFNSVDMSYKWVFTTALAALALGGIAYYAMHVRLEERWARLGLSMILGGALGNLIDRVYAGYVIDFVDVYYGTWHFWAFNVADASISIGAVLVFAELLVVKRHASHSV